LVLVQGGPVLVTGYPKKKRPQARPFQIKPTRIVYCRDGGG
jgi:hypothetical protein